MSKSKTLIIMLAVLVVLVAGCILMYLKPWVKDETITIFETQERLVGLTYTYEEEEIALERPESSWWIKDNDEFYVDQSIIALMEKDISSINAVMLVAENVQDTAPYGFDNPYMTITITEEDGDTATFILGDYNAAGPGYYMIKQGESSVYLVDSSFVIPFSYTMASLEIPDDNT